MNRTRLDPEDPRLREINRSLWRVYDHMVTAAGSTYGMIQESGINVDKLLAQVAKLEQQAEKVRDCILRGHRNYEEDKDTN